ncbi:MAG: hypothetical protein H6707_11570 [Deltaproteobacteria bacterium]|nr:hypothetical protein [Deltaproteobacteria bacterium]
MYRAWIGGAMIMVLATFGCASDSSTGADGGADAFNADSLKLTAGENPLNPAVPMFPFPSDFYLVDDATTVTGKRVEVPEQALPKHVPTTVFGRQDGYSVIPPILAYLDGGFDPKSLPSKPDATLDSKASVLLLEQTDAGWKAVPTLVELDAVAPIAERATLIIRPLRALHSSTTHVVVLRNTLLRADGSAHATVPVYAALRDGANLQDPTFQKLKGLQPTVDAALSGAGISAEQVLVAWSFTTRSEASVTKALLEMQQVAATYEAGEYKIETDVRDEYQNRQIAGTFKAPNFIKADEAPLEFDDKGQVKQFGLRDVAFVMTIPQSIDQPRPVVLYGHGFLGSRAQATRGDLNALCREYRYVHAAVNFGFHEDFLPLALGALTNDFSKLSSVSAEVMQSLANTTALARLIKVRLYKDLVSDGDKKQLIDPAAIHYMGASNGGTFGFVHVATSPLVERAILLVGGGGLSHFLERSVVWLDYRDLFEISYKGRANQLLAMGIVQNGFDPVDSMSYVHRLTTNRFSGLKPLKAALHMAVDDSQVNNLVSEWVARTADVPLITPASKDVWGLRQITAAAPQGAPQGELSALTVWNFHRTPSPTGNLPPEKDNGTHGAITKRPEFRKHAAGLLDDGLLINYCGGSCNFE